MPSPSHLLSPLSLSLFCKPAAVHPASVTICVVEACLLEPFLFLFRAGLLPFFFPPFALSLSRVLCGPALGPVSLYGEERPSSRMLEARAAQAQGSDAPVWLERANNSPLALVDERYGGAEQMERNLELFVWAAARLKKQSGGVLLIEESGVVVDHIAQHTFGSSVTPHTRTWADVQELLHDITAYAALGTLGGADQRVCDRLQPLLLRFMKLLINADISAASPGSSPESEGDDACDELTFIDHLISDVAQATVNCSTGVARRTADTALVVDGDKLASRITASHAHQSVRVGGSTMSPCCPPWLPAPHEQLRVTFGFADYGTSETAALLWAGAIGLSTFLMEKLDVLWSMLPVDYQHDTRVLEAGCGPALVSLTLAHLLLRWQAAPTTTTAAPSRVQLDVSDISCAAVEEARRSFAARNSADVAATLCTGDAQGNGVEDTVNAIASCACMSSSVSQGPLRVHCGLLDLGHVPANCQGRYHIVLASDIVYDHALTELVAPALVTLLAPGGLAVLCCEAHRDSMSGFLPHVRHHHADTLAVEKDAMDVEAELHWLETNQSLSDSSCRLMVLRRLA